MEIIINQTPESVKVQFNGRLDTLAATQAEEQVKQIELLANQHVIIDCERLDYISSSGLRLLLRISKAAKAQGGSVTLASVNVNVLTVLKMTGFDKILNID